MLWYRTSHKLFFLILFLLETRRYILHIHHGKIVSFTMHALNITALALCLLATCLPSTHAQSNHTYGTIPSNKNMPLQHRLAYHPPSSMMVSWNTYTPVSQPTVYYGSEPFDMTSTATSNVSVTYPTSTTWNNHVLLTGLSSATKYYYRVINEECYECGEEELYTFMTARAAGDTTPFSMAVVVDLGLMGKLTC